jgi:hypothetical protein
MLKCLEMLESYPQFDIPHLTSFGSHSELGCSVQGMEILHLLPFASRLWAAVMISTCGGDKRVEQSFYHSKVWGGYDHIYKIYIKYIYIIYIYNIYI